MRACVTYARPAAGGNEVNDFPAPALEGRYLLALFRPVSCVRFYGAFLVVDVARAVAELALGSASAYFCDERTKASLGMGNLRFLVQRERDSIIRQLLTMCALQLKFDFGLL